MTRNQKIELIKAVIAGQVPKEVLNGPQLMPICYQPEPGSYYLGENECLTSVEFEAYCQKLEAINKHFPDFEAVPPIVFVS